MKSVFHRLCEYASRQTAGTILTAGALAKCPQFTPEERQSLHSALAKLRDHKFLEQAVSGRYVVTDKTHKCISAYNFRAKPVYYVKKTRTVKPKQQPVTDNKARIDVLDNLINALAMAEEEIRNLRSFREKVIEVINGS